MARPPEQPRYALVRWPNGEFGCIPVGNVMQATMRDAKVIADERHFLPWPLDTEPSQSNPRRIEDDGA